MSSLPRFLSRAQRVTTEHGLKWIYKLSKRGDYRVHLYAGCRWLEGKTPSEQYICSECLDELQSHFTETISALVAQERAEVLRRHGVRA